MSDADERSLELVAELQRQFRLLEESRAATERITATATARDRSVAVEANAAGHIVNVDILTRALDRAALGAAITVCANQALQAAQKAAENRMAEFFEAQTAVLGDLAARTGVDVADTVGRESRPPEIPDHLLTEEAFRRSRG
ncbi:YbaB/EbfC family nucleoid-associated protein [Gordonia bronchialis]|uniref:YbaB/EbfC family nucleoid-associated protein n=1 Tax=Gordonia bronchialis TaxID=2054 RepID=UPI002432E828|nr:YbaB/EbfC family nucleoid-associated protein [Gordonia bronchialis]